MAKDTGKESAKNAYEGLSTEETDYLKGLAFASVANYETRKIEKAKFGFPLKIERHGGPNPAHPDGAQYTITVAKIPHAVTLNPKGNQIDNLAAELYRLIKDAKDNELMNLHFPTSPASPAESTTATALSSHVSSVSPSPADSAYGGGEEHVAPLIHSQVAATAQHKTEPPVDDKPSTEVKGRIRFTDV